MSAFLAIATAKEVLMKQEPTLLEEFGGMVSLDMAWAKSFMRRYAFKNAPGASTSKRGGQTGKTVKEIEFFLNAHTSFVMVQLTTPPPYAK